MSKVSYMLRNKKYPHETQSKIKRYLEFLLKQELKEDPEHENFIMNMLSSELRNELCLHSTVKYLKRVPSFRPFSDKTLITLSRCMKKACYSPEELVYRTGDDENLNVYFVLEGNLKLVAPRDEKIMVELKKFQPGDFFGEREVFSGAALSMGVVSTDFSTLFRLSRADFIQVLRKFPLNYEKFCQTKDLDILYSKHCQYNEPCLSCGLIDHLLEKCEFLRYRPTQLLIIHRYLRKQMLKARRFKRTNQKLCNALLENKNICAAQTEFVDLYQDDEELKNLNNLYVFENEEKPSEIYKQKQGAQEREKIRDLKRCSTKETFDRQNSARIMNKQSFITFRKQKIGKSEDINEILKHSQEEFPSLNDKFLNDQSVFSNAKEGCDELVLREEAKPLQQKGECDHIKGNSDLSIDGTQILNKHDALQEEISNEQFFAYKKSQQEPRARREEYAQLQVDAIRIYQSYFPHNNFTDLKKKGILK